MTANRIGWGVFAVAAAVTAYSVMPASAEFFGCKEPRTTVTYSKGYFPPRPAAGNSRAYNAGRARYDAHATYSQAPRRAERRADRW